MKMKAKYKHTNIIARDRRVLAEFYQAVCGCIVVPTERHLVEELLKRGTGVPDACFPALASISSKILIHD